MNGLRGPNGADEPTRICFFSSDSYGIGHVVRNARIASYAVSHSDRLTALVVTGVSGNGLLPLPYGSDYLRMPSFVRLSGGEHASLGLRIPYSMLRHVRRNLLADLVRSYRPLILVTNHLTKNIRAEIDLALEIAGEPLTRGSRVLSFDEVLADPEIVDRDWGRRGVFDFAASFYDEIWIHGERWLFDWEQNYRLPTAFARKLRYLGHLGARLENGLRPTIRSKIRAVYGVPEALPLIVITGGGGHDAVPMFEAYISSLRNGLEAFSLFLTGPRMSEGDSARVEMAAKPLGIQRSRVIDFVPNFLEVIAGADLVVSMGGFTVHEILATGTPVIFVPRGDPSSSQWLRTKIAAEHGWATVLPVERLTPRTLAASAQLRLADSRRVVPLTYDGFARVHKRLLEIAELVPTMPASKSQQSRVATDD